MTSDWLGGGLIVALAAVLWLIYLLPTWFRRNEFLSTERNTVRLQQTLRILAETSEVPDEVHVEANARSVAEQQRILKKANAQNLLAERAALQTLIDQGLAARAAAEREAALGQAVLRERALGEPAQGDAAFDASAPGTAARSTPFTPETEEYDTIVLAPTLTPQAFRSASLKLRRARAAASGILLLGLAVAVLGAVQTAVNGAWVVLVVGLVAVTLCITRLGRLAREGRALRARGHLVARADAAVPVGRSARTWQTVAPEIFDEAFDEADLAGGADASVDAAADVDELKVPGRADRAGWSQSGADTSAVGSASAADSDASGWTPVALPKPLSVGNRRIDSALPVSGYVEQTAVQAEQALRVAAHNSELALRAAQAAMDARTGTASPDAAAQSELATGAEEAPAQSAAQAAPQPAAPSRFAAMGVVETVDTGAIDVDRILARRRAG